MQECLYTLFCLLGLYFLSYKQPSTRGMFGTAAFKLYLSSFFIYLFILGLILPIHYWEMVNFTRFSYYRFHEKQKKLKIKTYNLSL